MPWLCVQALAQQKLFFLLKDGDSIAAQGDRMLGQGGLIEACLALGASLVPCPLQV